MDIHHPDHGVSDGGRGDGGCRIVAIVGTVWLPAGHGIPRVFRRRDWLPNGAAPKRGKPRPEPGEEWLGFDGRDLRRRLNIEALADPEYVRMIDCRCEVIGGIRGPRASSGSILPD